MNKRLIIMIGLPRSGKSAWALRSGYPVVSSDVVRMEKGCYPFVPKAEPGVWQTVEALILQHFAEGCHTVVLDACNLKRERRVHWARMCRLRDIQYVPHFIDTPPGVCMARAEQCGRKDLKKVIAGMTDAWNAYRLNMRGKSALKEEE